MFSRRFSPEQRVDASGFARIVGLIEKISTKRSYIEEDIRLIFFYLVAYEVNDLSHLVVLIIAELPRALKRHCVF